MGASSLRMGRLKRRSRALGRDRGAAVATRVVREEDLLVLEHGSAQPAAVNDARLEPCPLALPEPGMLAALLAGAVEELRPVLLVLGREVGIACRQVGHAGAPAAARRGNTCTHH